MGSREPGAGSREPGAGSREPGGGRGPARASAPVRGRRRGPWGWGRGAAFCHPATGLPGYARGVQERAAGMCSCGLGQCPHPTTRYGPRSSLM
ncbi:hypothetical protein EF909_16420 [Streptomyces sp. WAC01280]|nr:hypothetical protein EF909_16420 [Streptomyces sp. WAC01280]